MAQTRKRDRLPDKLAEAMESERKLAEEAAQIRGDATSLTPELFDKLYPLLRRPIPAGFIQSVGVVQGKPYRSTGIRSAQVQHDRMNAVLGPRHWFETVRYELDGKLCEVSVCVIDGAGQSLVERSSRGGVERGSSTGNIFKGSYTNAAKLAFARLGIGAEIYVGAGDFDPDTSEAAAREQAKRTERVEPLKTISPEDAIRLFNTFRNVDPSLDQWKLKAGELGIADAGTVKTALARLTPGQAVEVDAWLSEKADEKGSE